MRPEENPAPLTLQEHRELAAELKATAARLHQLCDLVVGVYGPKSPSSYAFQAAVASLDRVFDELEHQALEDSKGYVDRLYT